ncbi:sialate O-acetylesterase [Phragmitibacter flavus]|nr:sialate O-acetylesterase [Phragmitibacter flavus]
MAHAEVKLPAIFGDHMVLQRDMKLPVWGWAEAGEKVSVQLGDGKVVDAVTDAKGEWRVELHPVAAGGPFEMTVKGANVVKVSDILVGEVWVCSGQSNMEWAVQSSLDPQKEIAAANFPAIRHIKVPLIAASTPQTDFKGTWQVCNPHTVGGFTAAGYFMARELHKELGVAIGLINASWGGTRIEPWVPATGFEGIERLKDIQQLIQIKQPTHPQYQQLMEKHLADLEVWSKSAREALGSGKAVLPSPAFPTALLPFTTHGEPTTLYNAMVHPFVGFAMRGAIWYQGESNHGEGSLYTEKMKALVGGWRKVWNQGEFPFYYVQIAPFLYGQEDPLVLPTFWEAQYAALEIPNTGIVSTMDIADLNDIHPKNKQDVGKRLALLALKGTYGREEVVASGPVFKALKEEPGKLRVTFDQVAGGLKSRNGQPLDWFEIVGEDTGYVKADAVIEGSDVVLSAAGVKQPTAVRFGFNKAAQPNLVNSVGLPAYPFKAGEIRIKDMLKEKVAEAAEYEVLYDMDLSKLSGAPIYDVDNSDKIKGTVERVAWFVDLRDSSGALKYCYVSADALTNELKKLGIPTAASGASFQQVIKNARVLSNVPGLPNGEVGDLLNVEFWPGNYGPANGVGVPNASDALYDSGDLIAGAEAGYGSMQIHHHGSNTTLFAINNWNAAQSADIGIGNSTGQSRDWTFTQNAGTYQHKRLRVLVKMKK